MTLSVCIGSACHLKGSYEVKTTFQELIAANHLEEQVFLEVAFCLGHCSDGVTIRVDEEIVTGVSPQNANAVFTEKVLKRLRCAVQ